MFNSDILTRLAQITVAVLLMIGIMVLPGRLRLK